MKCGKKHGCSPEAVGCHYSTATYSDTVFFFFFIFHSYCTGFNKPHFSAMNTHTHTYRHTHISISVSLHWFRSSCRTHTHSPHTHTQRFDLRKMTFNKWTIHRKEQRKFSDFHIHMHFPCGKKVAYDAKRNDSSFLSFVGKQCVRRTGNYLKCFIHFRPNCSVFDTSNNRNFVVIWLFEWKRFCFSGDNDALSTRRTKCQNMYIWNTIAASPHTVQQKHEIKLINFDAIKSNTQFVNQKIDLNVCPNCLRVNEKRK